MGTISFLTPEDLPASAMDRLKLSRLAGGYDRAPMPTRIEVKPGHFAVGRDLDESAHVLVPWSVDGAGVLMASTATLIEAEEKYDLTAELSRGKLNQIRNHLADWRGIGLRTTSRFEEGLKEATQALGKIVTAGTEPIDPTDATRALKKAYVVGDHLIDLCVEQLFQYRRQRQGGIDSFLACRIGSPVPVLAEPLVAATFDRINIPFTWREIESAESEYRWEASDAVLSWALGNDLTPTAGPLIDFSQAALPEWLLPWQGDPASITSFMCDYVETVLSRYRDRIRRWTLCTGGNCAAVLGLQEDDLLRLTVHLIEAALQTDPKLELVIGIAQPWGEYMADEENTYSPFVYADTLSRLGANLAGFELEWYMGTWPRGSFCRDLLEASRLLDLFAVLSTRIEVSLGYPSSPGIDPNADPHQLLGPAGHWRDGFSPRTQGEWAARFADMALSKPYVAGVTWCHASDADSHLIPHGGLIDRDGQVKPAMQELRQIREKRLRKV